MDTIVMIPDEAEVGFLKSSIIDFTLGTEFEESVYLVDDNGKFIVDDNGKFIVPDDLN